MNDRIKKREARDYRTILAEMKMMLCLPFYLQIVFEKMHSWKTSLEKRSLEQAVHKKSDSQKRFNR